MIKLGSRLSSIFAPRQLTLLSQATLRASSGSNLEYHGTTVLNVRKGKQVAMIADGQISLGDTVFKNTAKKIRKLQDNVICGFAGTAADCLALVELLEKEFEKYPG